MRSLVCMMCLVGLTSFRSAIAAEREPTATIEVKGGVIAASPVGNLLAIGADSQGPLTLVTLGKANQAQVLEQVSATFAALEFSPNGRLLAAVRVSLDPPENNLSLWDVASKTKLWETKEGVTWVKFTPDGDAVVVGKFTSLRFFDVGTGQVLRDIPAHNAAYVEQGAFAGNGETFVTAGGEDHLIKVWDAKSADMIVGMSLPGETITALAVSDNGKWIAAAQRNILSVFNSKTGQKKWSNTDGQEAIRRLDFQPKTDQFAAANQDGHVGLWDAAAGKQLESHSPQRGTVQSLAYSADGSKLFVGASGATLVYSTTNGVTKSDQANTHTWKSANGKFKLSARFAGLDGPNVRLIRDDGKEVKVPLAQLSTADQELAKQLAAVSSQLTYGIQNYDWNYEKEAVPMKQTGNGLCFLSEVAGAFNGPTRVEVTAAKDPPAWSLSGKSEGAFLVSKAISLDDMWPALFSDDVGEFQWSQNEPPVKMLHKSEGFCYLAGIGGAFRGYGETVEVKINDDGYWYLGGTCAQSQLWAKAIAVKWANPKSVTVQVEERTWKVGDDAIDLLPLKDGLCFFSAISGKFLGGGEIVRITEGKDRWQLSGQSGQAELSARAMMIKVTTK